MKGKGREKSRSFLIMGYIYKIINDINNKVYIGQTRLTLAERWRSHKYYSKTENYPLYKAIRKYGIDKFHMIVIEECSDELLDEREIYWIEKYGSFGKGYNATKGGEGRCLYTESEIRGLWDKGYAIYQISKMLHADKASIRSRLKTYKPFIEQRKQRYSETLRKRNSKAVKQYTLDGEYITTFSSMAEAEKQTGVNKSTITLACQGKCKTAKGFQWRYEDDNRPVVKSSRYNPRPVIRIDKNGNTTIFESAKKAANDLNINIGSIHRACNSGITYKKCIWKYRKEIA